MCIEYIQVNMYHVSAQGPDERMIMYIIIVCSNVMWNGVVWNGVT